MSGNNKCTDVYGTAIHYMDLNDPSSFIAVNNIANRRCYNESLAMEWIYQKNVGVMIASNLGRPGGACSQVTANNTFEFAQHPNAKTQEESVLTFIHRIVEKNGKINYLETQLALLCRKFGMDLPIGHSPNDFIVKGVDRSSFNVRTSSNPDDYNREFGSKINVVDYLGSNTNAIYISYVAGPNASYPRHGGWRPRGCEPNHSRLLKFDTMFRTISKPAMRDYELFRSMLLSALTASLVKMLELNLGYAIMASPSSGIYAGVHQTTIQKHYHDVCIEALKLAYKKHSNRFIAVMVPIY